MNEQVKREILRLYKLQHDIDAFNKLIATTDEYELHWSDIVWIQHWRMN